MRNLNLAVFLVVILAVCFTACKKDDTVRTSGIQLEFSEDTVYFDTVLNSLSSVTGYLKVYNHHSEAIEIERISLAGGSNSFFKVNLDGDDGTEFQKVHIPANDSLFLFVHFTVDPTDEDNPILIKDSLIFQTANASSDVKLQGYGQDVHLFKGEVFDSQTWIKGKPYLIDRGAAIDFEEVLTIEPGTRIYLTPNSSLQVRGKIEARGTLEEPILFTGARFDGEYEGTAGQWGAVFIHQESTDNYMEHVVIKNASAGLQVGYPDEEHRAELTLNNCMILNSGSIGIYAFNANITAYNTVIADSRYYAILAIMGGVYNFYHCSISNHSSNYPELENSYLIREAKYPSLLFTNYFKWLDLDDDYRIIHSDFPMDLELNFYNSIIYGDNKIELLHDSLPDAGFEYRFDHCLLKFNEDSLHLFNADRMVDIIYNEDPAFVNDSIPVGAYDFQLDTNSAAVDKGSLELIQGIPELQTDFNGVSRTAAGNPDLGAYEREE